MAKTDPGGRNTARKAGIETLRVLVVEDHADMRAGLTLLFKLLGCQARFTSSLALARVAAHEACFDVLLSDINLPDGDGWTLVRELRKTGRKPGLAIAMSGFGGDRDVFESKEAGFDVHLVKPFAPEELTRILQGAVTAPADKDAAALPLPPKKKLAHFRAAVIPPVAYPCL